MPASKLYRVLKASYVTTAKILFLIPLPIVNLNDAFDVYRVLNLSTVQYDGSQVLTYDLESEYLLFSADRNYYLRKDFRIGPVY